VTGKILDRFGSHSGLDQVRDIRMPQLVSGHGNEKSRRLIRVSASGYVMVNIQLMIPENWNLSYK